jgi:hypothetical protein
VRVVEKPFPVFYRPFAIERIRLQSSVLTTQGNSSMRKQKIFTSSDTEHCDVSNAALTARESLMKDWPSELVALRVAPMGINWGPRNDDDDYLSIFHPSPGAQLVRLQVMQHFTITAATRHILLARNKGAAFWPSPMNVFIKISVTRISVRYCRNLRLCHSGSCGQYLR